MATISVPLQNDLIEFIDNMILDHKAETKAEVVRMALRRMEEEEAFNSILRSEQDFKDGKFKSGDLRKIIKGC